MTVRQFLRNLQTRGAFIAAFTSEIDDNQKKFIPPLAIDNEFFHSVFFNPCTMYSKTKGAVGAVCALLRNLAIKCLNGQLLYEMARNL